jgi:hypothetical protein
LQESQETFDLIVFALSEPFRPVTSGAFSLTEYYSLTIQSLQNAYDRLSPEGLLVITQWLGTPPAESAKAWSALLAAWDSKGKDPEDHLLAYRSMRTATLIASISPFREGELLLAREFFEKNGFDPIHLPDLKPHELNRFNRLPTPIYHDLYRRLRLETTETLQAYDLRIDPPTDDRPFFFHFFRWSQTPEILSQLGQQWLPFGGSGYLVLLALLVLMVVTGGILILIPTFMGRGTGTRTMTQSRDLLYFIGIGAGYLMVEIALLQRFTLLFDRPAFALAAVLFSMLLSSGVGSLFVPRLSLKPTLSLLILYLVGLSFTLHPLIEQALHWGLLAQLLLTMVALAPAGFLMGIPFARGLAKLQRDQEGAVAWAWAVNGAASGISGVLAVMISLDLGIRATLLVGTLAYLLALLVHLQRPVKTPSSLKIEL